MARTPRVYSSGWEDSGAGDGSTVQGPGVLSSRRVNDRDRPARNLVQVRSADGRNCLPARPRSEPVRAREGDHVCQFACPAVYSWRANDRAAAHLVRDTQPVRPLFRQLAAHDSPRAAASPAVLLSLSLSTSTVLRARFA